MYTHANVRMYYYHCDVRNGQTTFSIGSDVGSDVGTHRERFPVFYDRCTATTRTLIDRYCIRKRALNAVRALISACDE